MKLIFQWRMHLFLCIVFLSCKPNNNSLTILGNVEDPQNEIAVTIARVLNHHFTDSVLVKGGIGSLANLDSLEMGFADFGIVDNYSRFSDQVAAIMPLYPQVLHILHKRNQRPMSLDELLMSGKIFAGLEGSGSRRFVEMLISDLGLDTHAIQFVSALELFEADVIFLFTDLLTQDELKDLKEYKLYSIDELSQLGKGSLAEGICTRHPQFQPFVLARDLYGNFTESPVLTLKVDALFVCRADLDEHLVYSTIETLMENRQDMKNINPLLFDVSMDFDPRKLNFTIHPGAIQYLHRHEPTFLEKYAEVFSVVISVFFMLASGIFSFTRWQRYRKKNKIDTYYSDLVNIRNRIQFLKTEIEQVNLLDAVKNLQNETIELVTREKLMANESFIIFLNLSKIVTEEIQSQKVSITSALPAQ